MNLPNSITIGRLLLVPLTVWLIISEAYGAALAAFALAGVSDAIDGYLARRLNQRSELGAYLDPVADKALLVSVYVTLGLAKDIPAWLTIMVVSRDILIVGAIILAWVLGRPLRVAPLMVSKVNTVAQIVFAVLVLGAAAADRDFGWLATGGSLLVGALTVASGGAYLVTWVRHMAIDGGGTGGTA